MDVYLLSEVVVRTVALLLSIGLWLACWPRIVLPVNAIRVIRFEENENN